MIGDVRVLKRLEEMGLLPHQAEVVSEFVAKGPTIRGMLISAPGMSKSWTTAALVAEFIRAYPQARCAIVTAPVLFSQTTAGLGRWLSDVAVIPMSARASRALIGASHESGREPWPRPVVALWSFAGLKVSGLVRQAWNTFNADLLVIDEAHGILEPGADLVARALDTVSAVLVIADVQSREIESRLTDADQWQRWQWVLPLRDWDGNPVGGNSGAKRVLVEYSRDDQELEILRLIQQFYGESRDTTVGAAAVNGVAASSLFALESVLLRRRNTLAHHTLQPAEANPDQPNALDALPGESWTSKDVGQELGLLNDVLDRLADLSADSKVTAFLDLVDRLSLEEEEPIAVFTRFVRTQDLLAQALEDRAFEVSMLNGSMSREARDSALGSTRPGRSILLLTDAVLQGLDLRRVRRGIHFDLPLGPAQVAFRESRLGRFGGAGGSTTVFAFHSRHGSPTDEQTLREASFLDS